MNETEVTYVYQEEIVETEENEVEIVNGEDLELQLGIYNQHAYFGVQPKLNTNKIRKPDSLSDRKTKRMDRIADSISAEKIDLLDVGTSVIRGTSDRTLNQSNVEKALKTGISSATFLGEISLEALVEGMLVPQAADARYSMLGTSVMWNALKSNIRDLKGSIVEQTNHSCSQPRFDRIDLQIGNLCEYENDHRIEAVGVFSNADLPYVFGLLVFRQSARLLNKTKQFLKAYFIVACRPRCMIWRYTLRRSGNSHKKAILNLPQNIVQSILDLLLDLTGIGDGKRPFHHLNPMTPFYQTLGDEESIRKQRYYQACSLKDSLSTYFRDAITDVLNEIREMPFCLNTGTMISPLRGRSQGTTCVMWKDYEGYLKREHDMPSEGNMKKRIKFEQTLCDVLPRGIIPLDL